MAHVNSADGLLFPIGRLVLGSLYEPQTTDATGGPLVVKSGVKKGQPQIKYFFAVAIPKGKESHWAETEWGAIIWQTGHSGFPQGQAKSNPNFAWKIVDGDSQAPNSKGTVPCDREGYPGNWVISFSSGFAPKLVTEEGNPLPTEQIIKNGYYVQVYGSVSANDAPLQPGVFVNHHIVAFSGFGESLISGPDPKSVGFGGALPAGASRTPVAQFTPPTPVIVQPSHMASPVSVSVPVAPAIAPYPAILTPPIAPPPAPVAPVRIMTAKANGVTYEQYIGIGWTDAQLIQHGMMQP